MNLADVMHARRLLKNAQDVTAVYNLVIVVGVDVQEIYANTLRPCPLRELYDGTQIFSAVIYKVLVSVKENNPIAFSFAERDVARRRKIILPRFIENFRAEFLSNING